MRFSAPPAASDSSARRRHVSYPARSSSPRITGTVISVFSGRSSSTSRFTRRMMSGETRRLSAGVARPSTVKRRAKSPTLPSRPGFRNSLMLHSSVRRFSTGVPVAATRNFAASRRTAFARFDASFLIACASSSTTPFQGRTANWLSRETSRPYPAITTSPGPAAFTASMASAFSSHAINVRRVGAKRAISARQLPQTDAGATTSDAPSCARSRRSASTCTVLPRPMSSARHAPSPHAARREIHS